LELSYWLTLALAVPAGGLLVRLFIIVHDCGHGSFFRSRKACDAAGGVWLFYVHHLSPRIPNYKLAACHRENELFRTTTSLRLRDSLASLRLRLWDESARRLIGFRQVGAVSGR
jgi:fatty acid desaturase